MAENFKKITISIPVELDKVISALVEESKKTPNPINKSQLFAVSAVAYLASAKNLDKPKESKEVE